MNRIFTYCFSCIALFLFYTKTNAQVKVGDNPNTISSASLMELESTNKGFVFPRVNLTGAVTSPLPLASDILTGTVVYNTNTGFVGGVGLFIWAGSAWMAVTPSSLNSTDAWKLTGNAGTNPAINFLGTTDAQPLVFKVNSQQAITLATNTNVGIGTSSPVNKLDVNGIGSFTAAGGTLRMQGTGIGSHTYIEFYPDGAGSARSAYLGYGSNGTQNFSITNQLATGDMTLYTGRDLYLAPGTASFVLRGSTGYLGIGNSSPTAKLDVNGTVRFETLANGILTADASGNLSTTTIAAINGNSWSLTGNSGTNPANNFIGTTDAQPLVFKVNGQHAGYIDYTSSGNTSFGNQALNLNTSGQNNMANGFKSLALNTTGSFNTATGSLALTNNTTGGSNTANGAESLYFNTTGSSNTATGHLAMFYNTIGYYNEANGESALFSNTIGSYNTANGNNALLFNSTGNYNTATGALALQNNTTGTGNIANGFYSLYSNSTGNNNTATGSVVLYSNTTGNDNNGYGLRSLNANTTGSENVAYGDSALFTNTTGNFNTAIGHYADVSSNNLTNATAIGYKARVAISNAIVLGNNANVGIGTSSPATTLDVNGTVKFEALTNGILTADASGNLSTTTLAAINSNNWSLTGNAGTDPSTNFIGTTDAQSLIFKVAGAKSGWLDYSGLQNTSFGYTSLSSNTTGALNTAIGSTSLLANTTGVYNTASGAKSLVSNTSGSYNIANGAIALYSNTTGSYNTGAGVQSLANNTTGNNNTADGYSALQENLTGAFNTGTGYLALQFNRTGAFNTSTGVQALMNNTSGNNNTAIGAMADVTSANLTNATVIGYNAKANISNALILGDSVSNIKVGIGTGSPTANLHVKGTVRFAGLTNGVLTADANGNLSTTSLAANNWSLTGNAGTNPSINFIGTTDAQPLLFRVNGQPSGNIDYSSSNTSFGYQSLIATGGAYNTAIGQNALLNNNANGNTAIGYNSLTANTVGAGNVANGTGSLSANTTGATNTAVGFGSMKSNISGNNNIGIGHFALQSNTTGNYNIAIGEQANVGSGSLTNATAIGYSATVSVSNAVVLGNNANVGIGTSSPGTNAKVEIIGSISHVLSSYRYMNTTTEGNGGNAGANYSLYTSNRIWCGEEINVTSDMRTKTNIATSGSVNNLSLINKLRVVNYNYKDKVAKGTANITGFLAQEVEQVMPDAVTRNKGVVPDIYQNATGIKYDSTAKTLALTLKEVNNIKGGDTLKLITDAGEQLANVSAIDGNAVTVSNWTSNSSWVFVYGKQVSDLRNLDYNKIFSAGIGAIQELSKQNDELKKQNTSMQQDIETLKAQVKLLMDKMGTTAKASK